MTQMQKTVRNAFLTTFDRKSWLLTGWRSFIGSKDVWKTFRRATLSCWLICLQVAVYSSLTKIIQPSLSKRSVSPVLGSPFFPQVQVFVHRMARSVLSGLHGFPLMVIVMYSLPPSLYCAFTNSAYRESVAIINIECAQGRCRVTKWTNLKDEWAEANEN